MPMPELIGRLTQVVSKVIKWNLRGLSKLSAEILNTKVGVHRFA
jgi:hypothetical protein